MAVVVPEFFNRERELAQLEADWDSGSARLVTIWGRRRVGKSALLSRFATGKPTLYIYGTQLAEADLLQDVTAQISALFNERYLLSSPFRTWNTALQYLADRLGTERVLIVLDEFPYLCESTRGLDTLI